MELDEDDDDIDTPDFKTTRAEFSNVNQIKKEFINRLYSMKKVERINT